MKIVSFVYCDEVLTTENGKNSINNPLLMFSPVALPSNYTFMVSFGIYGLNKTGKNTIEISFVDPSGNVLVNNVMDLPPLPDELKDAPNAIGIQFNMNFRNVVLREEGEYRTKIMVNGNNLGNYPIDVIHGIQ